MSTDHGDRKPSAALREKLRRLVDFSDASWAAAEPCFYASVFGEGEIVLEAGEGAADLHFLLNGIARYFYSTPEGREFNKAFARPGQVLTSVSSLVNGTPTPFSIQALEPCKCISIKYKDLVELAEAHMQWNVLARKLLEQLAIRKERREADFLLLSASERYMNFLTEFADVAQRIPNYHIASYLGITEVALSRIRKKLGFTRINQG
jgi:CRP-like cAMP-binding protein